MLLLFLNFEASILGEVARTYRVTTRLKKTEKVLAGSRDPRKIFRDHCAKAGDVVYQPDIGHRETLDLLLGGLSALHIGGLHVTADNRLTDADAERIENLLEMEPVRLYYENYYPFAPPILVRENLRGNLPDRFLKAWREELEDPRFLEKYRRFLLLDQRFVATGLIGDFLMLLDDFYVDGNHYSDLHRALSSSERFGRWIRKKSSLKLLDSMESYFDFAEDLDCFLDQLLEFPIMRGHVWLHFAYWFGNGGDRMVEVINWLQEAIFRIGGQTPDLTGDDLRSGLRRLSNSDGYPAKLVQFLGGTLDPWLAHSTKDSLPAR